MSTRSACTPVPKGLAARPAAGLGQSLGLSLGLGLAAGLLGLGGCASTRGSGAVGPDEAASTALADPASIRRVVLLAAMPRDRDGDRSPDQYPMMVLLFGRGELPEHSAGTVVGELRLSTGEVVRRWEVPEADLARAARVFPAGPGYELGFQLDLESDRRAREPADIVVWFVPSGLDPNDPGVLERAPIGTTSLYVGGGLD